MTGKTNHLVRFLVLIKSLGYYECEKRMCQIHWNYEVRVSDTFILQSSISIFYRIVSPRRSPQAGGFVFPKVAGLP